MSTILIVDDKKDMCETLESHLKDAGYQVLTTTQPKEVAALLDKTEVDVLVTDLQMPGMTGLELLEQVKVKNPRLNVLVMTAYGTVEDAVTAMKNGAFDFLLKPFSMLELELKIGNVIQLRSLQDQNQVLKDELSQYRGNMVGDSPAMKKVYDIIRKVASVRTTVLITGESGTGKELVAQALHQSSPWSTAPFIRVNCAALAPTLLESELFGHEKGAFTGADKRKLGRFEMAQGGTLFLDEISEIPLDLQVKLLRVLQERELERVGGIQTIKVDTRVITASNRDLKAQVDKGAFREDLYYRLNVVTVHLPPLRERWEDIPLLAVHFINRFSKELGKPVRPLNPALLAALQSHSWPGNVRELQNTLERAVVLSEGDEIYTIPEIPSQASSGASTTPGSLSDILDQTEKKLIMVALQECDGVQNRAAKKLGVSRSALQYKIAKHHLEEYCKGD
jgi:two-component system NtrC family response regulator